jgi:hypothetical protein
MGSTYWDLRADKAGFSVELLFNGNRERVEVAYDAITGFKDRASNINLDIAPPSMPASPDPEPPPDAVQRVDTSSGPSNVVFGVFGRKRGTAAE